MSRFIALDAEQGQLYLASVIVKGTSVKLEKAISIAGVGGLSATTAADIGRRVKEAMKEAGIAPAPVIASVGRERVVLKEIKYPASVSAAEEPALVRFQVSKELAEGGDTVIIDYFSLPVPDPDGQRRALAFASKKEVINAFRAACLAAGLKLTAITPRPFGIAASVIRAIKDGAVTPPESPNSPMAVLVRGDKWGELVILRDGQVAFTRSLTGIALNSEAAMLGEIRRNLAVFAGQLGQPVQTLFVAEGDMPGGWSGRVRAGLTIPVQSFDPIAGIDTDVPVEARGCFAGLAGLAFLRARSAELPVNFVEPREPKPVKDPNKRMLAFVGAAAVVLLIGGIGAGMYMVSAKKDALIAARKEKNELEEEIKSLKDISDRVKGVKAWEDKGINWADEIYDLTYRFPDPSQVEVVQLIGRPTESKNSQNKYVAEMELNIQTALKDVDLVDGLVKRFAQDKHYGVPAKHSQGGGTAGPAGRFGGANVKNQKFLVRVNIEHREAKNYELQLKVSIPKRRENRGGDYGDGMDGGFGGFGGAGGFGGGIQ